jgi:hypothetical protein
MTLNRPNKIGEMQIDGAFEKLQAEREVLRRMVSGAPTLDDAGDVMRSLHRTLHEGKRRDAKPASKGRPYQGLRGRADRCRAHIERTAVG